MRAQSVCTFGVIFLIACRMVSAIHMHPLWSLNIPPAPSTALLSTPTIFLVVLMWRMAPESASSRWRSSRDVHTLRGYRNRALSSDTGTDCCSRCAAASSSAAAAKAASAGTDAAADACPAALDNSSDGWYAAGMGMGECVLPASVDT